MSFSVTLADARGRESPPLCTTYITEATTPVRAQKTGLRALGDRLHGRKGNLRTTLRIKQITSDGEVTETLVSVRLLDGNNLPNSARKSNEYVAIELPQLPYSSTGGGGSRDTSTTFYASKKSLHKALREVAKSSSNGHPLGKTQIVAAKAIAAFTPKTTPDEKRDDSFEEDLALERGCHSPTELLLQHGIKTEEKLGEGSFGSVYKAKFASSTGVAKIFKGNGKEIIRVFDTFSSGEKFGATLTDCPSWLKQHASLISYAGLYYFSEDPETLCKLSNSLDFDNQPELVGIVTDYGGLALNNPNIMKNLPFELKLSSILQGAAQLDELHKAGAVHRDIKLDNMVFNQQTKRAKIIDLGLAKKLNPETNTFKGIAGTSIYLAPEVHTNSEALTTKVDVWALGVTFIELISGTPFQGTELFFKALIGGRTPLTLRNPALRSGEIFNQLRTGFTNQFFMGIIDPSHFSVHASTCNDLLRELTGIIDRMLSVDPSYRLSAEDVQSQLTAFSAHYEAARAAMLAPSS